MKVVTRIAPSPTGQMHIGTVRTALFNYLFAKKNNGTYFVRIEDTDKERNREEWVEAIWEDFSWCGLEPDMRYRTSERLERHRELLKRLVDSGKAYVSKEPAKDDPERTVGVVRLRNPGISVTFDDLIRGAVTFDTSELRDFVIARAVNDPLYHFAVVVDDGDAGVTHILRAEEHISNTPRQILIQEALGFMRPYYGHLPLILAPNRSKLSKREHGASVENYRAQGILPEALINYLALLGWNPGTPQEIFSMSELIGSFSLSGIHKSGAIFDVEKLRWFNRHYLSQKSDSDFTVYAEPALRERLSARNISYDASKFPLLLSLLRHATHVRADIEKAAGEGEYDYFFADPMLHAALIPDKKSSATDAKKHLQKIAEILISLSEFTETSVRDALWSYATKMGRGYVLWPLRYALSGREKSPDPFIIASIIGKEAALGRVNNAIELLKV